VAIAVVVIGGAGWPPTAAGQVVAGVVASGGIGLPIGELGRRHDPAAVGGVAGYLYGLGGRAGLRAELGYGSFRGRDATNPDDRFRAFTLIASVLLRPVVGGAVHPYLLAGGGMLGPGRPENAHARWAAQAGASIEFGSGRVRGVVEGRVVSTVENLGGYAFVPVTVGVSANWCGDHDRSRRGPRSGRAAGLRHPVPPRGV
jgi:hypothetical protein